MKALDFEYDGIFLSDYGCIICTFDSLDTEDVSVGSQLTFDTIKVDRGKFNFLSIAKYEECITSEFQICKKVDNLMDKDLRYFTVEEQREIIRWLNRTTYLPLSIFDDGYETLYFEGTFNVTKIEVASNVLGFTLSLTTNRPFALNHLYKRKFSAEANSKLTIQDMSDEIGYIYADLDIVCKKDGDLSIYNSMDKRTTTIKNCISGEEIVIKDMIIETSNETHRKTIMNDFNYIFLRISNNFKNRVNELTFSIPCEVTISYSPARKVGI